MSEKSKEKVVIVTLVLLAVFVIVSTIGAIIMISSKGNKEAQSRLGAAASQQVQQKRAVHLLAVGDSITFGEDENKKSYADYMAEHNNWIKLDKISWGGLNIKDLRRLVTIHAYDMVQDVDVVTVLIGANDFGFDMPIEEFESEMDKYMKEIKGLYPNSRIVFLTPLYRDYFGTTIKTMGGTVNNLGVTLYQYGDVIKRCGAANGIEVIDLTTDEYLNADNIRELTSDGLHPNKAGNEMIADKLVIALGL